MYYLRLACKSMGKNSVRNLHYYMALSHEDWELQNSRIWLAKIDIDRSLDFPI